MADEIGGQCVALLFLPCRARGRGGPRLEPHARGRGVPRLRFFDILCLRRPVDSNVFVEGSASRSTISSQERCLLVGQVVSRIAYGFGGDPQDRADTCKQLVQT